MEERKKPRTGCVAEEGLKSTLSSPFVEELSGIFIDKKLIPTGFYVVISAAMLCFYSYVIISGGNPPPKKLHSSTVMS
ncbi:hypothetical protein GH714_034973 [Hevea brasiliensis]|uniref:Uncharacterized protein n=1 Tax=Hevea brasiliensis TaxID=3981 RepID=A0A6A6KMU4_HEVBR|nr:hypothetical protein GH714_034973 [Hevea brasiliensis]